MRAQQVSKVLTAISDAITIRLIQLAEDKFGPAPAPWCWTGFGSQARSEQLLGADQDNGMVIADGVADADLDWYRQVAAMGPSLYWLWTKGQKKKKKGNRRRGKKELW